MFGNNMEKLGYYDSPWAKVEVSADGSTIFKGRPSYPHAGDDDPVWFIIRISFSSGIYGEEIITTECTADSKNKWSERRTLTYQYI